VLSFRAVAALLALVAVVVLDAKVDVVRLIDEMSRLPAEVELGVEVLVMGSVWVGSECDVDVVGGHTRASFSLIMSW
jgi:hypothetical protein